LIIADVCEFYAERGGGVRTYIEQKFAVAQQCNVELVLIAPGSQTRTQARDGGRIHWIEAPFERFDQRYHRFDEAQPVTRLLDESKADVIEASSPWRGARIVADYKGKSLKSWFMHMDPVAVYPDSFLYPAVQESVIDFLAAPLWNRMRWLNARFDTSVVASHTVARRFEAHGLKDLHVVPLGIERAAFDAAMPSPAVRLEMLKACGFDDPATPLLLAVSRHHPEKRLNLLIRAVAAFNEQRPLALVIAGDGPWRRRIERQASACARVHLAGAVTDRARLASMMASSDALLHGGAAETFGIAVAEALCAGLPVIVPNRGGAADLGDARHAERYAAGDMGSLTDAMARMLDGLAGRRAHAREAATRLLTPAGHLLALRAHYERLLR
jgi:alpha-1,6-mannosyltransferase